METSAHAVASRSGDRSWLGADVPRRPASVVEALAALDTVTETLLARGDQRAVFPDIYGIITRRVSESVALGAAGLFLEPAWISSLAGRFCERYLCTLRWSLRGDTQDTGAWSIAYACCALGDRLPVHHVLLGLSAHINYDLALGIAATIQEHGGGDDPARLRRYKHDHDAVNSILRASVPEVFDHLVNRHACPVARLLYRRAYALAEWTAMEILTTWRERVWSDALALLRARTPAAKRRVQRSLERRSSRYARLLALPGLLPLAGEAAVIEERRLRQLQRGTATQQLLQALC